MKITPGDNVGDCLGFLKNSHPGSMLQSLGISRGVDSSG